MLSSDTARLFLALWPTAPVCEQIVSHARQWRWPAAARLTPAQQLHVTLHFIGSLPAVRVDELRTALAVPFEPFTVTLDQCELWKGGLAVLCARSIPGPLLNLHGQLAARLRGLALPVEDRPFKVHVTLARDARGAVAPPASAIEWHAGDGYALVQSLAGGKGYVNLHCFKYGSNGTTKLAPG
ncbi:MAG: RNA 2',3'-cyclic phosphodiesterase [Burkholderiales bacterium]|nr:RNA 2',3'-cyclic phosphodiesterase [Burkholderiales bacterium]